MPDPKHPVHIPPGFVAVTPYLTVDDPDMLVAFAKAAFAAEEMIEERGPGPDGKTMHTAFRIEGCVIETGRASGQWKPFPASIHLYVRDADATYTSAIKDGGVSLHDVRDMEIRGTVRSSTRPLRQLLVHRHIHRTAGEALSAGIPLS